MSELLTSVPAISFDGQPISDALFSDLIEVRTELGSGATGFTQLRFADADAVQNCEIGTTVLVEVADEEGGTSQEIFTGKVMTLGIEVRRGRTELIVGSYDASYPLGRSTGLVTHRNSSVADVISTIANEAGLGGARVDSALSQPSFPVLQQTSTPLHFVETAARSAGCEWLIVDDVLIVRKRVAGTTVAIAGDKELRSFRVRFTTTDSLNSVEVRGWDPATKAAIVASAQAGTAPDVPVAKDNWSARKQGDAVDYSRPMSSLKQATDRASSIVAEMESSALAGRGEVDVNASIKPGVTLEIGGVATAWNGSYYVTGVEHVFGGGGSQTYLTRFTVGALDPTNMVDLLGGGTSSSIDHLTNGFTIGVVSNVQDEDGLGRVKVKLPYVSDTAETDWARVIQQGGGDGRGWTVLPEIDDEVVVAFEHGDINRPIIVGGLWNGVDAPPIPKMGADGTIASRSFTSRSGHELMFSDVEGDPDKLFVSITLDDTTTRLFVGHKKIELHSKESPIEVKTGESTINMTDTSITLKADTITLDAGQKLTLEGAQGVDVKSGAALALEGSSGAELKGSKVDVSGTGPVTVKGSMVQVN